ncbi:MAG: LPS ABC transporter substrate-binding protein LptA, partial [Mesorhizobium sp.]
MRFSSSARRLAAISALTLGLPLGLTFGTAPSLAQSSATSQMSGLRLSGDKPIQIESDKLEVR